jgi:hypothetical protein
MSKASTTTLKAQVVADYGCGILAAPAVAILWAAQTVAELYGLELAKAELEIVNRYRERMGQTVAVPSYGDPLF